MHFYRYFTVMNAVLPEKQHYVHQQASTPGIDQSNTRRMGSPDHGTSNKISQSTATCGPHSRRIPGLSREHHRDEWNGKWIISQQTLHLYPYPIYCNCLGNK